MTYHTPTKKENIILGGEVEYNNTLPQVDDFEAFILSTCHELAEYDQETLAKYGIRCGKNAFTDKRDPFSYEYRNNGVLYMISCSIYNQGDIYFDARQYGETPEMARLREMSNGMIMGCSRSLGFYSYIKPVSQMFKERYYSFEGNEVRKGNTEFYVEGIIPEPTQKTEFNESSGKYKTVYKQDGEKLKVIYEHPFPDFDPKFYNQDGTLFEGNKPESFTTYPSFDACRDEMGLKMEAFKIGWTETLEQLRGKGPKSLNNK